MIIMSHTNHGSKRTAQAMRILNRKIPSVSRLQKSLSKNFLLVTSLLTYTFWSNLRSEGLEQQD